MSIRFLREAEKEVDEAFLWYEQQVVGLGYAFLSALDEGVELIRRFPLGFEVARGDLRKCSLKRFPFQIVYGLEKDVIVVVAVAHMHRKPMYWQDRTE